MKQQKKQEKKAWLKVLLAQQKLAANKNMDQLDRINKRK